MHRTYGKGSNTEYDVTKMIKIDIAKKTVCSHIINSDCASFKDTLEKRKQAGDEQDHDQCQDQLRPRIFV